MKYVIVGTAGHIDHGKTALVKALTGVDADRLKEEKLRGITIDIGFADLTIGDVRFGFVDVPGHERFVKNMLAGAHGLDMVMLVVSADESVMPQTREHFDICRLLGVKAGLVALTKSDLVDPELLELAHAEVEDFVRGSFLEGAPIIPVSSRTGAGIDELKGKLVELASGLNPKSTDAVPRLPVDRSFSVRGFGTVVTGTLIAGELHVGDEVEVLPEGPKARIRNLQVHGHDTDAAHAGQRTAVNLQGVNVEQAERGVVLAPAGRLTSAQMIDARLDLLGTAPRRLVPRARVRFHHQTAEVMARVVVLAESLPAGSPSEAHRASIEALAIEPGESGFVQLRLETPVTALPGDRFIIRSYSPQITIGGGVIIDAHPQKHRIKDNASANLARLEKAEAAERASIFVEMAGKQGMAASELSARTGATDKQIAEFRTRFASSGVVVEASASPLILISRTAFDALSAEVLALLAEHHRREPLSLGISREETRERLFGNLRVEVFKSVVQGLIEAGKIQSDRDALRLAAHLPALSDAYATAKARLEDKIKASGLQAGSLDEAAASAGVPTDLARKLYNLLAAERRVLRIDDMVYHSEVIEDLKQRIRARKPAKPRLDVAVFKEITGGLTRKHAIPLLEFLDRERVTRRVGNEREIL